MTPLPAQGVADGQTRHHLVDGRAPLGALRPPHNTQG